MANVRDVLKTLMLATLADEAKYADWTYDAVRPMYVPLIWVTKQKVRGDCSKGVQYLCKWAGGPDPMNMNFGPFGNSQTLWSNCQHLDAPADLQIGDFVTFGDDGDEHAAMVLTPGSDPELWSFGHQGECPNTYLLSQDGRPAQYLRNPVPAYVPTPAEVLQAKTGWFSWMNWQAGTGDWKESGPKNKAVRPNVPTFIPAKWWVRRAKFLLNRKKGNAATK